MSTNDTRTRTIAISLAILVVASFGVGTVASTTQDREGEPAMVRVAHMSPDAPAVDVRIDNETAIQDIEFSDVTGYLELESGDHQVTLVTSDNESVVFDGQLSLRANESYSVVAFGEVSENGTEEFRVEAIRDDPPRPAENNSTVRLFHASPDAGPVDVTARETGDVLFDNVTFANVTDYANVTSGSYTLEVRPATEDDDGTVVATFNESLLEDTSYTVFAAGYAAPEDAPADEPLHLFVAADSPVPTGNETTTATAEEETTTAPAVETTTEPPAEETTTAVETTTEA